MNDPTQIFILTLVLMTSMCLSMCLQASRNVGGYPQEQEKLFKIRDNLYRCVLHYKFNYMDVDE